MSNAAGDYLTRLTDRIDAGMGPAVVGLDPRLEALPAEIAPDRPPAERITAFYHEVLPVLAARVPAVKPNIAFFERHGAAGFAAYESTCRAARDHGLVVIGDIKRGDIGSTAEAYADIHLDLADAVTLHPYLGSDALEPFVRRCRTDGKGVFVLVKTSNPAAKELQDQICGAGDHRRRLCEVVAESVDRLGRDLPHVAGYSPVGAVVGATSGTDVAALRARMPHAWLLLPGVGAQGAAEADCAAAFDADGRGGLINQSRGVMQCFTPTDADWLSQIDRAAAAFAQRAAVAAGSERVDR